MYKLYKSHDLEQCVIVKPWPRTEQCVITNIRNSYNGSSDSAFPKHQFRAYSIFYDKSSYS